MAFRLFSKLTDIGYINQLLPGMLFI